MIKKFLRRLKAHEEGITGLETAIILITFVIVASVFAYVVLSSGLFSSQKAKEAVNAGLSSTMAVVELKGNVYAKMESQEVTAVYLYVGLPAAGNPIDFTDSSNSTNKVVISYHDQNTMISSVNWTLQKLSTLNTDNLLDPNELFLVTVDIASSANVSIGPYSTFALEMKPPDGPVLSIERTVPAKTSQYINLH